MDFDIDTLAPGALLRLRQIVSYKGRPGVVPVGRSKWLQLKAAGKIPSGRPMDSSIENSPTLWTVEEVRGVLEKFHNGEL
jgi:hypothetical protein